MDEELSLDEQIQGLAQGTVEYAKEHFQIDLDYSDESIKQIEEILDEEYKTRSGCLISALYLIMFRSKTKERWNYAFLFGAYIGEVLRRNHGGRWFLDEEIMPGNQFPALEYNEQRIWPAGKVFKRLLNGDEDNVNFYYQTVVATWKNATENEKEEETSGNNEGDLFY